jgi:putative transposase
MSVDRYRRTEGSVSALTYHFVWCPKFRRKVLVGDVERRLRELLLERCADLSCEVIALEVMPDHVHLFLTAPPLHAPQHIANQLKGYSSRVLREENEGLRRRMPSLWSRSYYVGSAGEMSAATIQQYIEQQRRS